MPRTSRHCNRLPGTASARPQLIVIAGFIDSALIKPRAGMSESAALRQMADDFRTLQGPTRADLMALGWTGRQIDELSMPAIVKAQALAGPAL
jgi:hypothetical protein